MYRLIDDLEFEREFRPLLDSSGAWRQLWWKDPADLPLLTAAASEGRIWTVVDVDGQLRIVCGNYLVNRLHYLVTEVPANEHDEIEVADLETYS